jgi:toxin-antitoxin system PIN domain toxin
LFDLNVLLYAVNQDAPQHTRSLAVWEQALAGNEPVGLSWSVILGFLRLTTRTTVFPNPLTVRQAVEVVTGWLRHPNVCVVQPGERHWELLSELLLDAGTAANLTTDAHLAVLAIEGGAVLVSTDRDFARFAPTLRCVNPLTDARVL